MKISTFKIDLGQGDFLEVHAKSDSDVGINEFVEKLPEKDGWIFFDVTAVNKTSIKRIEKVK